MPALAISVRLLMPIPLGLVVLLFFIAAPLWAQSVAVQGLAGNQALVSINQEKPRFMRLGESREGITLIKIDDQAALFKSSTQQFRLRVGENRLGENASPLPAPTSVPSPKPQQQPTPQPNQSSVRIQGDQSGHFLSEGKINGQTVKFLIDTGASTVTIGATEARRLGIDSSRGEKVKGQTAGGAIDATLVKIPKVSMAGLELDNVEAVVLSSDFNKDNFLLLGMSYLSRVKLTFENNAVLLERK